jgi:hypothetical protein
VKAAREDWLDGQHYLDPERLIFIDESGLSTKMARLRGWAAKGERCRAAIPHGHWKTITFVGGLTLTGFVAPMLLDGPMDGEYFLAWVEQMLAPLACRIPSPPLSQDRRSRAHLFWGNSP